MDRKEAVERIKIHMVAHKIGEYPHIKLGEALSLAIEALQEPERKKGKWEAFDYDNSYRCTFCGEIWTLNNGTPEGNNMNYCPNCGADMRGNKKLKQALAKELGCDSDEITRIIT